MDVVFFTDFRHHYLHHATVTSGLFSSSLLYLKHNVCMLHLFLTIVHISLLLRRLYSRNSVHLSSQFGDFSVIFFGKRCIFLIQTGQTGLLEYKYREIFVLVFSVVCTLLSAVE